MTEVLTVTKNELKFVKLCFKTVSI